MVAAAYRVVAMTDARTDAVHLVTDDAATVGRYLGSYVAVCGDTILAASLAAPDHGICPRCSRWADR
jgi:hypothetical protein